MKKSILIIGADKQWEEQAMLKAARRAGHKADFLSARDIAISLGQGGAQIFLKNKAITDRFKKSVLMIRRTRGAQETMIALTLLAKSWKVPFTDSEASIMNNLNKGWFMPSIQTRRIKPIQTWFKVPKQPWKVKEKIKFPLLAKPTQGRHGEGVTILNNSKQFSSHLQKSKDTLMIQPFLPIDSEYRIVVVGQNTLGVVQKIPKPGSKVANYAAGATFKKATLPRDILQESVTICQQQGIDIGGVDVAKVKGIFYLLEVNRCPEFKAFSKACDINVAEKIIEWSLKKF